jgi:hypothetical protein
MVVLMTAGWRPAGSSQGEPGRAAGPGSAAQRPGPLARQEGALEFRVVHARDKTPLPDVSIVVVGDTEDGATSLATDEDGRCRIAIPKPSMEFVGISARKEGFVPVRVDWQGPDIGAEWPESYTLALGPGTPIGGTVRDTRGRPVAGALVYVSFQREQPGAGREQLFLGDEYHVKADAQGGWRCTMMPEDLGVKDDLTFRLIHPDYVSEPLSYRRGLPIEALRGMTSVMVMEDGVPLTGRVVDSRGRPVVGARVFLSVPGYMINRASLTPEQAGCLLTETDADGRYRFGHIEPGARQVMVEAAGYVGQNARVVAEARPEPAEIRLTSMDEGLRDLERMLAVADRRNGGRGPNDLPEEWIIKGVLIVGAVVAGAYLISWRWKAGRRDRRVS